MDPIKEARRNTRGAMGSTVYRRRRSLRRRSGANRGKKSGLRRTQFEDLSRGRIGVLRKSTGGKNERIGLPTDGIVVHTREDRKLRSGHLLCEAILCVGEIVCAHPMDVLRHRPGSRPQWGPRLVQP
ncbi:hypothetical protein TNCV_3940861 [Trichonephila clavipes]|uniref:Uncharacterized protein n=1 Tax=Trichonephila clavipes TaxID=2585209 RepID=A0A8X6VVV6_TRICX|nr:hypothetical protein TNCV_3940861 [Trichonephila clavipes]